MENFVELATTLFHDELVEVTKSYLSKVLGSDSLLLDLPADIRLEEVLSQIAVEHGQSITIYIVREAEPKLKVIVPQQITVHGLKKAISRHFEVYQQRVGSKVKISWKYIWKTYHLHFDGIVLDDDASCIEHYGVTNKVALSFKKKRHKI